MLENALIHAWKLAAFTIWPRAQTYAIYGLLAVLPELLLPYEKQSWTSRLRGAFFLGIYIVLGISMAAVIGHVMGTNNWKPLITIDFSGATQSTSIFVVLLGFTVVPMAGQFVKDFFYYWMHRLQHAIPVLWHFHRVHHALEEMNAFNANHHPMEEVVSLFLLVPALTLLVSVSTAQVATAVIFIYLFAGAFIHSNTRLSLGPLGYLVAEPSYHRLHHSLAPRHFDKNFAGSFPLWDVLFGTAYLGWRKEHVATGIADFPECRSTRSYLLGIHPSVQSPQKSQPSSETVVIAGGQSPADLDARPGPIAKSENVILFDDRGKRKLAKSASSKHGNSA